MTAHGLDARRSEIAQQTFPDWHPHPSTIRHHSREGSLSRHDAGEVVQLAFAQRIPPRTSASSAVPGVGSKGFGAKGIPSAHCVSSVVKPLVQV